MTRTRFHILRVEKHQNHQKAAHTIQYCLKYAQILQILQIENKYTENTRKIRQWHASIKHFLRFPSYCVQFSAIFLEIRLIFLTLGRSKDISRRAFVQARCSSLFISGREGWILYGGDFGVKFSEQNICSTFQTVYLHPPPTLKHSP